MKNLIVLNLLGSCRTGFVDYVMNACNPFSNCESADSTDTNDTYYTELKELSNNNSVEQQAVTYQPIESSQPENPANPDTVISSEQ